MPYAESFANLVVGSGAGGKHRVWHLAPSGQSTAVVERRWIGGSCPNVNCLSSKNEIWSAKVVSYLVHHAAEYGAATGPWPSTWQGFAINVGTHAAVPSIPGLEAARPLTNVEALDLDYLPSHLIVLGGGYVGLELAQAYRRFGSRVTVIQQQPQLMAREDRDLFDEIQRILVGEGIDVLVAAETRRVQGRSGEKVGLVVHTPTGAEQVDGTDILVAVGRTPSTARMGLERAGVELDERGYIRVNERLQRLSLTRRVRT